MLSQGILIMLQVITIIIAVLALIVSSLAVRVSKNSVKASIFDQRFGVYSDTEKFISAWVRIGEPEMSNLYLISGAWVRSKFLFEDAVSDYLKKVWEDAVKVFYINTKLENENENENEENRGVLIKEKYELLRYHSEFENLRAVFSPSLKLAS